MFGLRKSLFHQSLRSYPQANPRILLRSLSRAGSRRSVNYDPTSYESRRLLNLEEISSPENSMKPEGRHSVLPPVRNTLDSQSPPAEIAAVLPRAKSEVALYTPMRRKSLLTPGVATRTPTPVAPMPSKPKPRTRHSLPATPARRESLEPLNDAEHSSLAPCESRMAVRSEALRLVMLRKKRRRCK